MKATPLNLDTDCSQFTDLLDQQLEKFNAHDRALTR